MPATVDLHTHTLYSDGLLTPQQLLFKAHERGLSAIAITDHDTVDAIEEAERIAPDYEIEVVPGIEISCMENDRDIHILGYCIDIHHQVLRDYCVIFKKDRERRAKKIVENLQKLSVNVNYDDVAHRAGDGSIGRPHIAAAMIEAGYVATFEDAFRKYLSNHSPAYEPRTRFSVKEAADLIHSAGGVAILAHPGRYFSDPRLLLPLLKTGLDGIEVTYPSHGRATQQFYHVFAKQHNLLETGGSDFHGSRFYDEDNFGRVTITYGALENVRERAAQHAAKNAA
ncbi:MAG: PHP domain-containing protein [Bacteroidota bacterium]